ncbi:MAG: MIP/aquaporin family protein [Flavobacteriales bacterium]
MRKYTAEFLATFILVFCGTGAIIINDISHGQIGHAGIATVFGLVVMAMIYSFGEISGAHMNPAVSIAFWISGRFPGKSVVPYVISQLLGAFLASAVWYILYPDHKTLGATLPAGTLLQTFVLEVILTFILMLVIMQVSTGSKETGTMAGLAIGAVVWLEAMFAGPVTGASMNPARSLAPAVFSGETEQLWIYIAAPLLGAIFGILGCVCIKGHECCALPNKNGTKTQAEKCG